MPAYRVAYGDSPSSIVAKMGFGPAAVAALVRANPQKPWHLVQGVPTFTTLQVGERLWIPPHWRSQRRHMAQSMGVGSVPLSTDCNQMDLSRVPPDKRQAILDACNEAQQQIAQTTKQYMQSGYNTSDAQSAAQTYQAAKALSDLGDYFKNPPNTATMSKDQIQQRNEHMYNDLGLVTAAAISVIATPVVGALFWGIFQLMEGAAVWLGNILGLYDPLSFEDRSLFENPCDPSATDFGTFFPNGVPSNPNDPRWVTDPMAFLQAHPGQGARTPTPLASPPYDKSRYVWLSGLNPSMDFESTVFGILTQNSINAFNCGPSLDPSALLDSVIQIWNETRDRSKMTGVRRIDVTAPPERDPGACNGNDVSGCLPPDQTNGAPMDPITYAFQGAHFDWNAYYADGKQHWKDTSFFEIVDAPPFPAPHPHMAIFSPGASSILSSGANASAGTTDVSTKWAWGLGLSASFATAALYWYARNHHLTMRQAAQQLARQTKQRIGQSVGRRRR